MPFKQTIVKLTIIGVIIIVAICISPVIGSRRDIVPIKIRRIVIPLLLTETIILKLRTRLAIIIPRVDVIQPHARQIRRQIDQVQIVLALVIAILLLTDMEQDVGFRGDKLPILGVGKDVFAEEVAVEEFHVDALRELDVVGAVGLDVLVEAAGVECGLLFVGAGSLEKGLGGGVVSTEFAAK